MADVLGINDVLAPDTSPLSVIPPPDNGAASYFDRNAQWALPGAENFTTDLGAREPDFLQWIQQNKVPFDPTQTAPQDYDMRGFWSALMAGDPRAASAVDPNDQRLHYPDFWKTPYHETFSNESQWAAPNAPRWNDKGQLVAPDGTILFDDRSR